MRSHLFAALTVAAALTASTVVPAMASAAPVFGKAIPVLRPNWGVVSVFAVTGSVIFDAMYIAATQCREMTAQEAGAATIPFLGPLYNSSLPNTSKCKK